MTLFKTALPAVAVAGGLTAAILGLGAAPASAEAQRVLGWAARGVELGLGRSLGRVDQRRLHHAVFKPCQRWRLIPLSHLPPL